ncbi:unnamed protein product [Paramecium sonneborni]|uniref:Uncharacterized protein n=1 Tax=Paramecium sonneborni TaxID=65129 RepID=A0A8S1Q4U6_9CILI|nr:unnamed protein product [Paramecium sonneborni]
MKRLMRQQGDELKPERSEGIKLMRMKEQKVSIRNKQLVEKKRIQKVKG